MNDTTTCSKSRIKTLDLCVVCNAQAIVFFRRNALKNKVLSKCRFKNSCEITKETRRFCSSCRLQKCFQQGMRKERIRRYLIEHGNMSEIINNNHLLLSEMSSPMNISQDHACLLPINDVLFSNLFHMYREYFMKTLTASNSTILFNLELCPF
ncbi:unnamed protein product [Rotaria sp. Silwood1]|nr:unnamed protein product [Rotaria sp. Silwood1]